MRLMIADDHLIFRQGLRLALEASAAVDEIVEAEDFETAMRIVTRRRDIDLLILDLEMPGLSRSTGITTLRGHLAPAPILILSASDDSEDVFQALAAGATGYVPKSAGLETLLEGIRTIRSGGVYLPRAMLAPRRSAAPVAGTALPRLTPRQSDVLGLVAEGHPNKEIAYRLGMSEGTVKTHLSLVMRQMGVKNRVQLLREVERLRSISGDGMAAIGDAQRD